MLVTNKNIKIDKVYSKNADINDLIKRSKLRDKKEKKQKVVISAVAISALAISGYIISQ
tara:strand:+ start:69 stop:245 length:177 start_codon:yes stop_codon:yes gene_type:complete